MRMELHDKGLVLSALEIPGGPIFSVLPEKIGEKRGAEVRLVRTAGTVLLRYIRFVDRCV